MSGRVGRRRPYFRKNAEGPGDCGSRLFELQPQKLYHTSKKHSKQNYLIVYKGLKHFVADVYAKNNGELFVDNLCLSTGDKKEQLRFPFIKWIVTKESLAVQKHCLFCSIAWLNRDLKARPVLSAVDRPGKMTVYTFERKSFEAVNKKKNGLAPLRLNMKNNTSRWPLAVEKIAVSHDFKKVISVKKFSKKKLLAGEQAEVEFLVNKNLLPYGSYGVPITVSYQNALEPEIQEIQIPLKFMVVSPAYSGSSQMKTKRILPNEEEIDEESPTQTIAGIKYMPFFADPRKLSKEEAAALKVRTRLRSYPLPAPIRELHNAVKDLKGCDPVIPSVLQTKLAKFENVLSEPLTASNYAEKFGAVLHLEEFHEEREIAKYNMWKVPLQAGKALMYRLTVGEGLAEGRPSLMPGDIVFVIRNQEVENNPSKSGSLVDSFLDRKKSSKRRGQCFYGTIKRVHLCDIVFECEDLSNHKPHYKYNIQFSLNRFIYRLCYRALNLLNDNLLRILLPQGEYRKSYEKRQLVFFNEDIAGNPEQVQAITNIVSRSCTPFPYIVFGPPGTGKTKTLVEAILQNWAADKFQLVCASSNSAADVIVEEILKLAKRNAYLNFEPSGNILRIYSASVEIASVSETILNLQIHNFRATNEAKFPLMSLVLKTPIIVGTLATAARLSLEGVPANHFSHVYVDECGHCSEPECILAVSGIIGGDSSRSGGGLKGFWGEPAPLETQLVLAGDPQQLGSTTHCNLSQIYNYSYSLLERLLNTTDMYQRDGRTGKYNAEVITKLSRNYRSHADIINISNQLFYHGELLESGKQEILNSCSEIDFLPQKNHPVIFHGVTGLEEQDNSSPSYYNLNEVDQVVTYISMLIEEANEKKLKFTLKDIGVVTPYKKQVQKLAQTFSDLKWEDVAVGSVDLFQGSEKLIIIISTVRGSCNLKNSSGKSAARQLDFVNDPKGLFKEIQLEGYQYFAIECFVRTRSFIRMKDLNKKIYKRPASNQTAEVDNRRKISKKMK